MRPSTRLQVEGVWARAMSTDSEDQADGPIFTHDGRAWTPSAFAAGPFGGLHGGAVSGLMVAGMEAAARRSEAGAALSASALLLRPTPLAPLALEVRALRQGGRVSVFEAILSAEGKRVAQATATFARAAESPALLEAPDAAVAPDVFPPWRDHPRGAGFGFFAALDIREEGDARKWGRLLRPLTDEPSPLADIFAVADCATAFDLSGHGLFPAPVGHPNADIAIHVSRPPQGAWVGVAPSSDWRREGFGLTEARLYDEAGPLGRSAQAVVIVRRE
jgi:acyl-CoA thioesterase